MNTKSIQILFMGTPGIAARLLEGISGNGIEIGAVITRPDKPRGRGGATQESEVKKAAKKIGIPVYEPRDKAALTTQVRELNPELIIVAAFGMILPTDVLAVPKYGAINVHPSLLPLYRGPAPIEAPILNGDQKTGVTIMEMSAGMDEGNIIEQKEFVLNGSETAPVLEHELALLAIEMLTKIIPNRLNGDLGSSEQDHSKATYTKMLKKEDGHISFAGETSTEIERKERAFQPWPGIYTYFNDKKLDLFEVQENDENVEPGRVIARDGMIIIGTSDKSISVGKLRLEGKNKVAAVDFLRGYPDITKVKFN